jgi:hypothetical protein
MKGHVIWRRLVLFSSTLVVAHGLALPVPAHWIQDLQKGYGRRCQADARFPLKSLTEVVLAAGTQLAAEYDRRGAVRIVPEIDFVVAGVLTAMYGKYASMWKVAPTRHAKDAVASRTSAEPHLGTLKVPTNAFQPYLLDGVTVPNAKQRLASLVAPMLPLFRAGVAASLVGYGVTAFFIALRSSLVPSYEAATRSVNIVYASLYTGAFMAVVSNLRYQILQGVVEPVLARVFRKMPILEGLFVFGIRVANGLLGSLLAIAGMRLLGLQQLK